MKAPWRRIWGWLVPPPRTRRLNSSGRSVKLNYWLVIKASSSPLPHIKLPQWPILMPLMPSIFLICHFICLVFAFVSFWTNFRGEPVVCFSSPAGESVQLPGTLLPPTARHCSLPGSLSVHDDKVNIVTTHFKSFSVSFGTRVHCFHSFLFFFPFFCTVLLESSLRGMKSMIVKTVQSNSGC